MREVIASKNDSNQRLDKFLSKLCPSMPQSMLYKSLRKECIKINSKHIKDASYIIKEGDIIKLFLKDEFFEKPHQDFDFTNVEPTFKILYEDDNILIIDKAVGIVVHTDDRGTLNTLSEQIKSYLFRKGEFNPEDENTFVPSLCNRLDRNTGGIIIAAKNAEALRIMNQKIKDRELKKTYLCVILGTLPRKNGELKAFLFKDEKEKRVYIYDTSKKGTKTIITRYKVLKEKNDLSLVEVELVTGRTHQIRAHFASIGHPLLGDGKYGKNIVNKEHKMLTQALYSYKLTFDFSTPAGELEYLNKKTFTVNDVYFTKMFE